MLIPEMICPTKPFENGAGPTWCYGNSLICRVGNRVFVTNSHVNEDRLPYNRTHLELFEKEDGGEWKLVYSDEGVYQREPCYPLYLGNNRLAIVVNPTVRSYEKDEPSVFVPCVPSVYLFDISDGVKKIDTVRLTWDDPGYEFFDHSYRSSAVDPENGNMIFANQYVIDMEGYHCYSVVDQNFKPIRQGKLEYPARSCYHNIAMKGKETYIFAIQDIHEPVKEWAQYKLEKTGNHWDYDFRRIYLSYSPDIEKEDFRAPITVCHRDDTCGWIGNLDCTFDANGDVWFLAACRSIWHDFMRDHFFPDTPLECTLELYRISKGEVKEKIVLDRSSEEDGKKASYGGTFHTASNGDVYLAWSKGIKDGDTVLEAGTYLSRLDALNETPVKLMDHIISPFGSKTRLGGIPCDTVDLYWVEGSDKIMYARYDLK